MQGLVFDEKRKLISWQPKEDFGPALIARYFEEIAQVNWGNDADRYCDLSLLGDLDLDYEKMRQVVSIRKSTLMNARHLKLGIYAPQDFAFATARMYQSVMSGEDMEILVSREISQVGGFLGVSLDGLFEGPRA